MWLGIPRLSESSHRWWEFSAHNMRPAGLAWIFLFLNIFAYNNVVTTALLWPKKKKSPYNTVILFLDALNQEVTDAFFSFSMRTVSVLTELPWCIAMSTAGRGAITAARFHLPFFAFLDPKSLGTKTEERKSQRTGHRAQKSSQKPPTPSLNNATTPELIHPPSRPYHGAAVLPWRRPASFWSPMARNTVRRVTAAS